MGAQARVTEAEVLEIVETGLDAEKIAPHIASAHNVVERNGVPKGYSEAELKEHERWLAAHFFKALDPDVASERAGEGNWTFDGKTGMGLDQTRYGQNLRILDPLGAYTKLGTDKGIADIQVLGI